MGLKMGTVTLEEYNPIWIKEFETEKEALENVFGNYAVAIEHVGSTAIPGLTSKPIIDIAVGVEYLESIPFFKDMFSSCLDYSVKEDSVDGEVLVVKRLDEDTTTHLIHIMELDADRYNDTILFRDYIINNLEELNRYEKLKKELAVIYADNRKMYTNSKNEFIKEIISKAK